MNGATMTETAEPRTFAVRVEFDEDPMSPREWDNLSVMACRHRRYNLGDEQISNDDLLDVGGTAEDYVEYLKDERGATVVLPLYLLDHSGLSIRAGSPSPFDPGGWDTSHVGFVFDTPETRAMMGTEDPETIEQILRDETETYSLYLQGMVYGYVVEDDLGDVVESCWGFYEREIAQEEGEAVAEHAREREAKRVADAQAKAIGQSATLAWNGEEIR